MNYFHLNWVIMLLKITPRQKKAHTLQKQPGFNLQKISKSKHQRWAAALWINHVWVILGSCVEALCEGGGPSCRSDKYFRAEIKQFNKAVNSFHIHFNNTGGGGGDPVWPTHIPVSWWPDRSLLQAIEPSSFLPSIEWLEIKSGRSTQMCQSI